METILVLSDSDSLPTALKTVLAPRFTVAAVDSSLPEPDGAEAGDVRFVFCDVEGLEQVGGSRAVAGGMTRVQEAYPAAAVVVVGAPTQMRQIVGAIQAGAVNYLTCPIEPAEVNLVVRTATRQRSRQLDLSLMHEQTGAAPEFETRSDTMRGVYEKVKMVAPTNSTVLLTGETGVGKGVIARMIHEHSARRTGPFISVHCGAIPDTLVESELFGHEKGSFTGALRRKLGKFEIAEGGTIFLDEIGTISAAAQIKLLRVLQERQIQRVGGETDIRVDVRIIAAANEDLAAMARDGNFRTDLFYRLNVFPLHLPALRDRLEDLPLLVDVFLARMNELHQRRITAVNTAVVEAFAQYNWPGNIRELENVIERGCILATGMELQPRHMPEEIMGAAIQVPLSPADLNGSLADVRQRAVELVEREYLKQLLTLHRGRINESAAAAGIGVRQLHKLMQRYGIEKAAFKGSAGDGAAAGGKIGTGGSGPE